MSFSGQEALNETVAIIVNSVSKDFDLDFSSIQTLKALLTKRKQSNQKIFSALKDISFTLNKGQTLGIIGRNGSGKSTLLEIISGVAKPTAGYVKTNGRIVALLELGIGFNPAFTGRENVIFNATLLGLSKKEILSKFDEIEKFADIGQFIDQPVRIYSSGMYARLAFAVSIHVSPDILIIDEALAVGDEVFQRKCFAKIEEIKRNGATILFVSHSTSTIINLCDEVLLLHEGQLVFRGKPKIGVYYLQKLGNAKPSEIGEIIEEARSAPSELLPAGSGEDANEKPIKNTPNKEPRIKAFYDSTFTIKDAFSYEPKGAVIHSAQLMDEDEKIVNHILNGSTYKFRVRYEFFEDCEELRTYVLIRTKDGIDLAGCAYPSLDGKGFFANKGNKMTIDFKFKCLLNPGIYFCNFALQAKDLSLHHRLVDALAFRVMASSALNHSTGLVDLQYNPIFHLEENEFYA